MSAQAPYTDVTVGGTSLRTIGANFRSRWGWENTASVRGRPIPIAYRDGGYMQAGGTLDSKILGLDLLVWGRNRTTGYVTTDPWQHLDDNMEWLKGLLGSGEELDVRFARPDGDAHQAYGARVLDAWEANPVDSGSGPIVRARIPLWVPEGTLRDISGGPGGETDATNVNLTGSGSANITVGGNVRTSPVITVTADSTVTGLTFTFPDGATLSYSGSIAAAEVLVFDCALRQVTLDGVYADAGLLSTGRRAYWGRLEPASTNALGYSVSGGQFDLTVQWYDRWR